MSRPKPPIVPLSALEPNQFADCFEPSGRAKSCDNRGRQEVFHLPLPRRRPDRFLHGLDRRAVLRGM